MRVIYLMKKLFELLFKMYINIPQRIPADDVINILFLK